MIKKFDEKIYEKNHEKCIDEIFENLTPIPPEFIVTMKKELKEKMKIGLQKYGEKSYQKNEENFKKVNTIKHAIDEVLDLINYLINCYMQSEYMLEKYQITEYSDLKHILYPLILQSAYILYKLKNEKMISYLSNVEKISEQYS